jgi:hypothetical protein
MGASQLDVGYLTRPVPPAHGSHKQQLRPVENLFLFFLLVVGSSDEFEETAFAAVLALLLLNYDDSGVEVCCRFSPVLTTVMPLCWPVAPADTAHKRIDITLD